MLIRFRTTRPDNGFSFIELLAYMAIAALLILAAIPQFAQYREKANITNLQSDLRNAATAIEGQALTDLNYPTALPSGVKASPNNTLTMSRSSADGYCVTGTTAKGISYHYDSQDGGIGKGACAAFSGPGGGFTAQGICTYDAKVQHMEELNYQAFSSADWVRYLKARTHRHFVEQSLAKGDGKYSQADYAPALAESNAAQDQWFQNNALAHESYYYSDHASTEFTSDELRILGYISNATYPTSWGFIADDSNSEFVNKISSGTTTYTEASLLQAITDNQAGWGAKVAAACATPQSQVLGS